MPHKTLIVTYYWPPSGGAGVQRFLKFAKYLPQFGVEPVVLTVENPSYPITDPTLGSDVAPELKVHKTRTVEPFAIYGKLTGKDLEAIKPTVELSGGSLTGKLSSWIRANIFVPDARVGWIFSARKKAATLIREEQIDSIITTGPPHSTHFVGTYCKRETDARWIADFRDPWSQIYYNQLMPRMDFISRLDRQMEQRVLKRADEVIVVSPTMAKRQKELHERPYHVIPNGFDPDDFAVVDTKPTERDDATKTIRFIGSVREGAIPSGFLKALAEMDHPEKVRMEFIGNAHPQLEQLIHRLGLEKRVSLIPYVPHDEAVAAMQSADLLMLSITKTPQSELILAGKMFEYIGSGRPILFLGSTTGDAAGILRESGQGVCFEHGDDQGIRRFLDRFATGEAQFEYETGPLDQHPFSRVQLTEQLAQLLKSENEAPITI